MAAARLGYRVHIYCPEARLAGLPGLRRRDDAPPMTIAMPLARFAGSVDVITFEFENVPSATAELLAAMKPTRPRPQVLHICQDRLREKDFLDGGQGADHPLPRGRQCR